MNLMPLGIDELARWDRDTLLINCGQTGFRCDGSERTSTLRASGSCCRGDVTNRQVLKIGDLNVGGQVRWNSAAHDCEHLMGGKAESQSLLLVGRAIIARCFNSE